MAMLTSILLILGLSATALSAGCPPEEDISPCTCIQDDLDVSATLTCLDEKLTLGDLKRILATFDRQDALAVELSWLVLGRVPGDFFAGVNVRRLELWHCRLESLGEKPLAGLEDSLEVLIISDSVSDDKGDFQLPVGHLTRLQRLELSDNSFPSIGNDWFRGGPKSLTHLVLSNNWISYMGRRAFEGLENLETFYLDGNRFGELGRTMLPSPAAKLVTLGLDNNALTSLCCGLFHAMPSLQSVSLRDNGLARLPAETFGRVWEQLEELDVRGNSLACDSHLEWMLNVRSLVRVSGTCATPPEKEGVELQDVLTGKVRLV